MTIDQVSMPKGVFRFICQVQSCVFRTEHEVYFLAYVFTIYVVSLCFWECSILGDYHNSFLRSKAQIRVGQIPDLAMVFKKSYHNYFDAQT